MNDRSIMQFESARENACTEEMETIECEYCDDNFARPLGSDYSTCSKKCYKDACAEFHGDV